MAVNAVAPEGVTNDEFARTLASTLHRPAWLPAPAFALRFLLGTPMADETLLADLNVTPGKLTSLGYPFRFRKLDEALAYLTGTS